MDTRAIEDRHFADPLAVLQNIIDCIDCRSDLYTSDEDALMAIKAKAQKAVMTPRL